MTDQVVIIPIETAEQRDAVARAVRTILDRMRVQLPIQRPCKIIIKGTQGRAYLTFYPPYQPVSKAATPAPAKAKVKKVGPTAAERRKWAEEAEKDVLLEYEGMVDGIPGY